MATPISRGSITLSPANSAQVFAKVLDNSAFMRLARQVPLTGSGENLYALTADGSASSVAEGAVKPVANDTLASKVIRPYKFVKAITVTDELLTDEGFLVDALTSRLAPAIGKAFDAVIAGGTLPSGASSADFGQLTGLSTSVSLAGDQYANLATAFSTVLNNGWNVTGLGLSYQAKGLLWQAVDGVNRPLFNSPIDGSVDSILGFPTYYNRNIYTAGSPNTVGFAGDFENAAVWGSVGGINVKIDSSGTIGGVNLLETNQTAIIAELRAGFQVIDKSAFVALTDEAVTTP